ncbi:hypothetical protein [Pseudoflavonifractor sp. An85]|uniref:hypothetical protein n=1 Tax=Pseudoflavonifractor sp. An85 TaxID=1965661 RepID=UPI000B3A8BB0|nr:hypothetical protein [Pseudoflavonifractor sp. An85]OUN25410.1 hypothetical protein B5G37_04165 [Pseudoflavonifractor sp. An85]
MNKGLNWVMLISLLLVFASGLLLKPMPGMWLGILHGVSGIVLFVSTLIHVLQRVRVGKKAKTAG